MKRFEVFYKGLRSFKQLLFFLLAMATFLFMKPRGLYFHLKGEIDMELNVTIKIEDSELEKVIAKLCNVKVDSLNNPSSYARFFDESSPAWTKDAEYNLVFLKQQQEYANDLLKAKGYLYLNEVYEMLGIPRTRAGQVVGWVYNKENQSGDNYVDFGIFTDGNSDFVNGRKRTVLIDPNVDGMIIDKVHEEES
jgi:hypothetical protein